MRPPLSADGRRVPPVLAGSLLAGLLFAAAAPADPPRALLPEIVGEPWTVAGRPDLGPLSRPDEEPVDFAVWRAGDGTWQLWSCIRKTGEEGHGRLFHRWESPRLEQPDWRPMGIALRADPRWGEQAGGLQAPFVFRDGDRWLMVYGDWQRICLAASADGKTFERVLDASGSPALFGELPRANARDPLVLRAGSLWHCYYTGAPEGKGAVFARTSPDLRSWSPRKTVHTGGVGGDGPWSAECPHVVERGGLYYLFRTQRYGRDAVTHVYRSPDPLDFAGPEAAFVASLPIAAPELVIDGDREYLASLAPALDGIRIAHLRWTPAGPAGK